MMNALATSVPDDSEAVPSVSDVAARVDALTITDVIDLAVLRDPPVIVAIPSLSVVPVTNVTVMCVALN